MNLTIEQMRKIVDGAPDWAQGFCFELSVYAASSKGSKLNILAWTTSAKPSLTTTALILAVILLITSRH